MTTVNNGFDEYGFDLNHECNLALEEEDAAAEPRGVIALIKGIALIRKHRHQKEETRLRDYRLNQRVPRDFK